MKQQKIQMKRYTAAGIIFALALLCFLGLAIQVWSDRNNEVFLEITADKEAPQEVSVWIEVTKSWQDVNKIGLGPCYGAQYDGFVQNHMKNAALMNWELEILLPAEAKIDSSWNGEYIKENGKIYFKPQEDLDIAWVKPDATEGFGFIVYSYKVLELTDFVVRGYKYAPVASYPLLYLGSVLLLAGCIVLAWQITFVVRTRKLEQRRINDEKIIVETMQTLANFIDAKDEYTRGHSTRVSAYSVKLARKMHLEEDEIRQLGYIALMHDCGKMGIPDNILNKPGKLTAEERAIIEQHTVLGGKILENMTSVPGIRDGALYHHERYDGKGYPEGLSDTDIPLYARIICVADSFDAMNSDRCYRKRLPMEEIKRELRENAGLQFDPEIVKYMLRIIEEKDLV